MLLLDFHAGLFNYRQASSFHGNHEYVLSVARMRDEAVVLFDLRVGQPLHGS